jgi:hypothetical protein
MLVVQPMVSTAAGAFLIAHLPTGQWRLTMLLSCHPISGLSLMVSGVVITVTWQRLSRLSGGCRWITKPWWPT